MILNIFPRTKREVFGGTKIQLFEFGVKYLNFSAIYLNVGAIYLSFSAKNCKYSLLEGCGGGG